MCSATSRSGAGNEENPGGGALKYAEASGCNREPGGGAAVERLREARMLPTSDATRRNKEEPTPNMASMHYGHSLLYRNKL
jgi:hypothetical protein